MTRTLELTPDTEAILERAAATRDMTLDDFLSELAEREAERLADSGGGPAHETAARPATHERSTAFLELTAQLLPVIAAGTLVDSGAAGPTEIIDAVRHGREAEINAALMPSPPRGRS